jgi:hypothetical protein
MVKARQASYHPLGTESLQGLEVKVPEALVPLPRLVVPTSSKAEGFCYLHIEDIESIGASGYLDKKAMMTITNPHDSILDLHTGGIPNLMEPQTSKSSSVKNSRRPVM